MSTLTRRSAFAAFAAALVAPIVAPVLAHAQGATNGPAGGVPSTTAPSNSAGTPAGGTGVISTTRTQPAPMPSGATANTPLVGGQAGTSESTPRRRRHRHRSRHHITQPTATPQ